MHYLSIFKGKTLRQSSPTSLSSQDVRPDRLVSEKATTPVVDVCHTLRLSPTEPNSTVELS